MEMAHAAVVFHSCRFYDVPRVLIADSRAFQALAAILDYVTHLVSMSCWHVPMPDKMNLDLKLLYCEFQKYEVMTMSVVGGQPRKHANTSYKATKHIDRTCLISDYF